MNVNEYLTGLLRIEVDAGKISAIENIYGKIKSEYVVKIISGSAEAAFLANGSVLRVLSFEEIKDAGADFSSRHLLPLFDCGDNDFIVYHVLTDDWSKFNATERVIFKRKQLLTDLL